MRLIDADEMIKKLRRWKEQGTVNKPLFDFAMITIMGQPTVYDADVVVKQLENERELSYANFDQYIEGVCPNLETITLEMFKNDLIRTARKNWLPSQVEMLEKLIIQTLQERVIAE